MQALLTVDQLSAFLQKSAASIRSDVTRNPQALPPICRLPGTKRLLWRVEDVEAWLEEHVVGNEFAKSGGEIERARSGRPTKASQIAKQRSYPK
ncbi:DNA-binding protein [Pseudomonas sp. BF61]|uniref:helix-turn-helix transcriptional regulator n=1 Tax=Pseudomonas sp. BF61 TaxID=2741068 RepID=UPI001C0AA5CE|nr:DNA-binding protein [Pseudomonas sp. BF61]MBU4626341.1 DNA-binding protein [Pseudomonas sp. BF61]